MQSLPKVSAILLGVVAAYLAGGCTRRSEPEHLSKAELDKIVAQSEPRENAYWDKRRWITDPELRHINDAWGCGDKCLMEGNCECLSPLDDGGCKWSLRAHLHGEGDVPLLEMAYKGCLPDLSYSRMNPVIDALGIPTSDKEEILYFIHSPGAPKPVHGLAIYEGAVTTGGLWGQGWSNAEGVWVKTAVFVAVTKTYTPIEGENEWTETLEVTIRADETAADRDWIRVYRNVVETAPALHRSRQREED